MRRVIPGSAAFSPAMRPKVNASASALPPKRLPAWMPPVTSPAAYQARNYLAVHADDFRLRVDLQAAHRVVDLHHQLVGIEGRLLNFDAELFFAKLGVNARIDEAVVLIHLFLERGGIKPINSASSSMVSAR